MDGRGAARVVQDADSFADVERALRVEQIMDLSQERRDGLMIDLVYELRDAVSELRDDVSAIKRERSQSRIPTSVHALGHVVTLTIASAVGLLAQPWANR